MAEAKAVGLKEQSPLGWFLARRALLFKRDGFSLTHLRLKIEFANRIASAPHIQGHNENCWISEGDWLSQYTQTKYMA